LHVNTLDNVLKKGCNCDLGCDIKISDICTTAIDATSAGFSRDSPQ